MSLRSSRIYNEIQLCVRILHSACRNHICNVLIVCTQNICLAAVELRSTLLIVLCKGFRIKQSFLIHSVPHGEKILVGIAAVSKCEFTVVPVKCGSISNAPASGYAVLNSRNADRRLSLELIRPYIVRACVLFYLDQRVNEIIPSPVLFKLCHIYSGSIENVFPDNHGVSAGSAFPHTGQLVILTIGLVKLLQVVFHAPLFHCLHVVGHILYPVADCHNLAAVNIRRLVVCLADDVRSVACIDGRRHFVVVINTGNQADVKGHIGLLLNRRPQSPVFFIRIIFVIRIQKRVGYRFFGIEGCVFPEGVVQFREIFRIFVSRC